MLLSKLNCADSSQVLHGIVRLLSLYRREVLNVAKLTSGSGVSFCSRKSSHVVGGRQFRFLDMPHISFTTHLHSVQRTGVPVTALVQVRVLVGHFCLLLILLTLPPQAKVQEYYKRMNELVNQTYSEEDRQIIGCPSIQQVCIVCKRFDVRKGNQIGMDGDSSAPPPPPPPPTNGAWVPVHTDLISFTNVETLTKTWHFQNFQCISSH